MAMIALGALAILGGATAPRWADGPVGPVPGGRFRSGRTVPGTPSVTGLAGMAVVELELGGARRRSVLTGVPVLEDEVFVPTTLAPLKRWDRTIDRHPRVRLRVGEEIFEGALELVTDAALIKELFSAGQAKYGKSLYFADWAEETKFFRWSAAAQGPLPRGLDGRVLPDLESP